MVQNRAPRCAKGRIGVKLEGIARLCFLSGHDVTDCADEIVPVKDIADMPSGSPPEIDRLPMAVHRFIRAGRNETVVYGTDDDHLLVRARFGHGVKPGDREGASQFIPYRGIATGRLHFLPVAHALGKAF